MHEIGITEDVVRVRTHPGAFIGGRVAVIGRSTDAGKFQRLEGAQLIVCKGLGGREVERGAPVVGE